MNQIIVCQEIMDNFADETGVAKNDKGSRYLWTDAFAVFNYLELFRQTSRYDYLDYTLRLIDQVHNVLGKHRSDDLREGWISGLNEAEGKRHPTIGGLRIGKEMAERKVNQTMDPALEWDRDGQYFHYLSKWMLALDCASRIASNSNYHKWAMELGKTAHAKFMYVNPKDGSKQMYWKMSIDLTYPLVESMGQHDPLEGLITYLQLQTRLPDSRKISNELSLNSEIEEFFEMCEGLSWVTTDTLGIGGMLVNSCVLMHLMQEKYYGKYESLLLQILEEIEFGLNSIIHADIFKLPASYRLAFRELGLSIGLHALELMENLVSRKMEYAGNQAKINHRVDRLLVYKLLANQIEEYWLQPENQKMKSWIDHYNINTVMLATSLAPRTFILCD
jgi:hypothetical protein